tara:strand:+ start:272 stop:730 length:459 start_codon:yes stop_codon:yes gene_type:complete
MVDPLSAYAAISSAAGAISAAVKAGRDLASLGGQISKYAKAEADLQHGASTKKNSIFSKLGVVEESAIEKHFKQEEVRRLRNEMRSLFQLYGSPGQWERLQQTIAEERARRQRALKLAQHKREQMITIIIASAIGLFGVIALGIYVKILMSL